MKRILLYAAVLAVVLIAPVDRMDVGKLQPVQAVWIYKENDFVVIKTDTQDKGVGATAQEALENLKATTPAVIYLDTADYLLLTDETEKAAEELRESLKESVRVCSVRGTVDPAAAAQYLNVHGELPRLKHWKMGDKLPILNCSEERIILS